MDLPPSTIITVTNDGPVSEIQTAVSMAEPNQTIQVKDGFYKNFVVDKPDLTIEAVHGHNNVVILADKGDSISIQIPDNGGVTLRNLRVAHTVSKTELDISKIINILSSKKKTTLSDKVSYKTAVAKDYSRNLSQICLLRIIEGNVYASNCFFSLLLVRGDSGSS